MDSGLLSLTLFVALLGLLFFADLDLPPYIIFFFRQCSSWSPVWPPKSKAQTASKAISSQPLPSPSKLPIKAISIKPSIKVEIPSSDKRQLSSRKTSTHPFLHPPTFKGVDDHWGTHTWCPTIFKAHGKVFVLLENGTVYLRDDGGRLHSATEMPQIAGGVCRIPGEKFTFSVDGRGYLFMTDDCSQETKQLDTWCLDNDPDLPQSGSPHWIPGRGCFSFRMGHPPLQSTMFGLDFGSFSPVQVESVSSIYLNQPPSSSSTDNSLLPCSPIPSPSSSTSPNTPRTPPDYTAPHGQTSVERRTCPHCNKVLRRPGALRIHIYSHIGHKPWKCVEVNCNYASTNETNLRRHMQTMHDRSQSSSS